MPLPSPISIDFTAANDACSCMRYYLNRHVRGLVPVDQELSLPLLFGDVMHRAIALLATGGTEDDATALINTDYGTVFDQYQLAGSEIGRTPYVARSLLYAYITKYGTPQNLQTEIGAHIDMGSFQFYGRIDRVAVIGALKTVADIKTTGGAMWLPQARLNWQLVGYAYMVQQLTDIVPEQVAIDGIIIPRPPRAIQNNPPPEWEYALTLQDNLQLRTASVQPRDYVEWKRWIVNTVMRIEFAHETGEWPMRAPLACTQYGKACQYDPLCKAMNEEQEQRLVESLYVNKPWHPFNVE